MPSHLPVPHGRVVTLLLIAVIVALGAGLGLSGILRGSPAPT